MTDGTPSPSPTPTPDSLRRSAALLAAQRLFDQALEHLWTALALQPDDVLTLNDLANTLVNARRPDDAIPLFLHALSLLPDDTRLYNNLGLACAAAGLFDDAHAAYQQALLREPRSPRTLNNLACLLIMQARHHDALASLETALQSDPHYLPAKRNRALAHLALGNFSQGWEDYDWCAAGIPQPPDPFPRWNGQPLANRRIVLTARQGLGDTLQFIRYAPLLKSMHAYIILECPLPLLEVLRDAPGIDQCVPQGQPLPPADLSVPLLALPRLFRTSLDTIPATVPYLRAHPERLAAWRGHPALRRQPGELLVGICWQGNPHHQWDRFRSLPLALFEPLTRIPRLRLLSLQRGPGIDQIPPFQHLTHNALLVPTTGTQQSPDDLADSAALMSLLDLIITVDTATCHLAGALARPVWTALSLATDWRWLTDRPDTPWYPTMRLFRQTRLNDWPPVLQSIARQLPTLIPPTASKSSDP